MIKLKHILEATMSTDLDTYKIADSFTPSELKRLKADGKISGEVYNGAIEIQRGWKLSHPTMKIGGGAYRQAMLKQLKEFRPPGKISGEPADEQGLTPEQIEADMKEITGYNNSASKRGNLGEWRVRFYAKRELPAGDWNKAIKHITDVYGAYIDKEWTRNDYEANYDREEPPEWVPSIYFEEA